MHAHTHTHKQMHAHPHTHTHTHKQMHTHTHTHTHTHIHTHTHTRTHINQSAQNTDALEPVNTLSVCSSDWLTGSVMFQLPFHSGNCFNGGIIKAIFTATGLCAEKKSPKQSQMTKHACWSLTSRQFLQPQVCAQACMLVTYFSTAPPPHPQHSWLHTCPQHKGCNKATTDNIHPAQSLPFDSLFKWSTCPVTSL